jgi:uncharacterized LabA/DUF88 family protein
VFAKKQEGDPEVALVPRLAKELRGDSRLVKLIRGGIQASSDESGWAQLSPVGSYISRTANDFDPRNYGYAKLSELIAAIGLFDIERRETRIYAREMRKKQA